MEQTHSWPGAPACCIVYILLLFFLFSMGTRVKACQSVESLISNMFSSLQRSLIQPKLLSQTTWEVFALKSLFFIFQISVWEADHCTLKICCVTCSAWIYSLLVFPEMHVCECVWVLVTFSASGCSSTSLLVFFAALPVCYVLLLSDTHHYTAVIIIYVVINKQHCSLMCLKHPSGRT